MLHAADAVAVPFHFSRYSWLMPRHHCRDFGFRLSFSFKQAHVAQATTRALPRTRIICEIPPPIGALYIKL